MGEKVNVQSTGLMAMSDSHMQKRLKPSQVLISNSSKRYHLACNQHTLLHRKH